MPIDTARPTGEAGAALDGWMAGQFSDRRAASIDRRPNGRWRARWRPFPNAAQKARTFDRKADAERFLVEVQHKLNSGTYVDPSAGRVNLDEYADVHPARQPWRAATVAAAENALRHARAKLGSHPMGSIRKGDVQGLVSGLNLAPSTTRIVFQHLYAVLEAAVDDGIIGRNPARGVRLPARPGVEVVPPTVEQVTALYDAAAEWFRPAIVLGAGLGLRQAEASGLTADRVLWLERSVRVDRQLVTRRGPARFEPPKTESSNRTIPASAWVVERLSEHVGRRHQGYVLHRDGQPVTHGMFNHAWRATVLAAELGDLVTDPRRKSRVFVGPKFHDLRHAFASMLIAAGCSVKAVQNALGHASASTTLDLYAHIWPGDEDRIGRRSTGRSLARLRTG